MEHSLAGKKERNFAICNNKLVVISGERRKGRGKIGVGYWEAQTISYKINYKDILYSTGNIANILQ